MHKRILIVAALSAVLIAGCSSEEEAPTATPATTTPETNSQATSTDASADNAARPAPKPLTVGQRLRNYAPAVLDRDLSDLTASQREVLRLLIEASGTMNRLFWQQAYDLPINFIPDIESKTARKIIRINYGPWDRLNNDEPMIDGVGPRPPGANFYPTDMTDEEFEAAELPDKTSLYTYVERSARGSLRTVPYHERHRRQLEKTAQLLRAAADYSESDELAKYLKLRASALLNDEYQTSDLAWLDMQDNLLDIVIGPIETYEDQRYGYKAGYEAYVLIKDREWTARLQNYMDLLPQIQPALPVADEYKQETPGLDGELAVYDAVYLAGHANAGPKTIAINLPNDEWIQLNKGTRRLQLKNIMREKFDKILVPLSAELISVNQRPRVQFDVFFTNTLFHEISHGLGIKNTLDGSGTVREALKELASPIEEAKADIMGLYALRSLHQSGALPMTTHPVNYHVTFVASLLRSTRFGASSAHGRANLALLGELIERGGLERERRKGTYIVNFPQIDDAVRDITAELLTIQGNGDYAAAAAWLEPRESAERILLDLNARDVRKIPVDLVFEQGTAVLGLN